MDNIIDSAQAGVGKYDETSGFTGMVLGVRGTNYGLYGYSNGYNTISILANNDKGDGEIAIFAKGSSNPLMTISKEKIHLLDSSTIYVGDSTFEDYIKNIASSM